MLHYSDKYDFLTHRKTSHTVEKYIAGVQKSKTVSIVNYL